MKKAVLALLLVIPFLVSAETDSKAGYVSKIDYTLEQPFGGFANVYSLAHYFTIVYQFALGIVGIFAVVLIMFGGLRWVAAAGNESIIGEAKEIITSAVVGLAIALLSYIILAFINPQFTSSTLSVPTIVIGGASDIWQYEWCNTADFSGKDCAYDGGTGKCETVACGVTGVVDGAICRGAVCEDTNPADGTEGCYRDASDPSGKAKCLVQNCGNYVKSCYDAYKDDEETLKLCLCAGYNSLVYNTLHFPPSYSDWTLQQTNLLESFCNEGTKQADWVTTISGNPGNYGYTGATGSIKDICWNLGAGFCKYDISTGYEISFIPFYMPEVTIHSCIPK